MRQQGMEHPFHWPASFNPVSGPNSTIDDKAIRQFQLNRNVVSFRVGSYINERRQSYLANAQ